MGSSFTSVVEWTVPSAGDPRLRGHTHLCRKGFTSKPSIILRSHFLYSDGSIWLLGEPKSAMASDDSAAVNFGSLVMVNYVLSEHISGYPEACIQS